MDDLFLVIILGKCGQGLLGGARNESWLLEPGHSGFLDFKCELCMFIGQVIYDSLFPDNPKAIRSLDIEDWDAFCSPWAHDRFLNKSYHIRIFSNLLRKDEEKFRYTLSQCGLLTGTT